VLFLGTTRPSKIFQNWHFWHGNKPSGKPVCRTPGAARNELFVAGGKDIRSKDLGPSKTELKRSSKRRPGLSWVVQLLKVFFTSYANGLRSYMSCGNFVPPLSLEVLVTFFFSGEIEI
jgi:hypothetical protein